MASTEGLDSKPGPCNLSARSSPPSSKGYAITRICNGLAVDMCKQMLRLKAASQRPDEDPAENVAFSPLAVASALSMVLAGTGGRTMRELSGALHGADNRTVHEQFRHVFSELGRLDDDVALSLANRLYADDRLRPSGNYQATLEKHYQSPVESIGFHVDPDACRSRINACVERTTCSWIKELLPPGSVDAATLLALVSALYFKGRWIVPFDPGRTVTRDFHETRSRVVRVRMMSGDTPARLNHYCDGLPARAVELAYAGGRVSMTLLVPDQMDGLGSLLEALTPGRLERLLGGFDPQQDVQLELPRFKLEETTDLKAVLNAMGVKDLFDPHMVNLPGFTTDGASKKDGEGAGGLPTLSVALHKASIEVNEEGTETTAPADSAAAAGGVILDPSRFRIDRPFYLLIRCLNPEVILLAGSVRRVLQH
ncbi:iris-like [Amblyomma americanum]